MKRSYTSDTKAAVMAALLQGQAASYVAREYNIPESTVKDWGAKVKKGEFSPEHPTQKKEVGDLLLEYLRENMITLRAQAEFARDTHWLGRQSAESFAVLHGVMTDKAIRLLEAFSKFGGSPDATGDPIPED